MHLNKAKKIYSTPHYVYFQQLRNSRTFSQRLYNSLQSESLISSNDALKYMCPGVIDAPRYYRKVHFEPKLSARSGQGYAKMRFRIFYDKSMDKQPPDFKSLTQEAVDFWSDALSVRPYDGTMFIKRDCGESGTVFTYSNESKKYEEHCLGPCAKMTTCQDKVIPEDHLKECTHCLKNGTECHTTGERGKGIQDADMVFYVSATQTKTCGTTGIAYARPCSLDTYMERPIAGGINICPLVVLPLLELNKELVVSTLKHEMMHSLGFSRSLYNYFRDSNGEPLVERDEYGRPTLMSFKNKYGPKILKRLERKLHVRGGIVSSNRTFIVTPNVVREARAHFNCSELEGAELEDFGGSGTAGTHWETRVYLDDTMKGSTDGEDRLSRIDLALLEDTGWYKVNYSLAEPMKYGKDLGCDFCMNSCKYFMDKKRSEGQSVEPFCDQLAEKSSNFVCNNTDKIYSGCPLFRKEDPVSKEHQYFDKLEGVDDDDLHFYSGIDMLADFCPLPYTDYSFFCSEKLTSEHPISKILNPPTIFPFEGFGNDSHCFESRTKWTINQYEDTCSQVKPFGRGQNAGCYKYSCMSSLLVIQIVNRRFPCFFEGQVLEISLFRSTGNATHEGTIVCPSCKQICGQRSYFQCIPDNPNLASKYPYARDECIDADYLKNIIKSLNEEGNTTSTVLNDTDGAVTLESDTWTTMESLTSEKEASVALSNNHETFHQRSQSSKLLPKKLIRMLTFLVIIIYW